MKLYKAILAGMAIVTILAQHGTGLGQNNGAGSLGSPPYQPAMHAPSAAYEGACSPTAPGAALQGMSRVISSAGEYNLSTSAGRREYDAGGEQRAAKPGARRSDILGHAQYRRRRA